MKSHSHITKFVLVLLAFILVGGSVCAQSQSGGQKRERKKNLVVKEWNTKAGAKTPYLDNMVTYDHLGRKIEEIEYASYGQKKRTVYEYDGDNTKCSRQVEYDDKNHITRIKKFEYNDDGTRSKQYNYKPNGKLESTKNFEYSYK
jgi:hypothetical protein